MNDKYSLLEKFLKILKEEYNLKINFIIPFKILNYDVKLRKIIGQYLVHDGVYCMTVKSSDKLRKKCVCIKEKAYKRAEKEKESYFASCYAGVTEWCFPVTVGESKTAILCLSGFREHSVSEKKLKYLSSRLCLEKEDLEKIYYESLTEINADNDILKTQIEICVSLLKDFFSQFPDDILIAGKNRQNIYVKSAIEYIHENYTNGITPKEVAKYCCISQSHMEHLFLKNIGRGVHGYIKDLQMSYSARLLLNSDCSVSDIAAKSGFINPDYFSYIFKKRYGVSPLKYRNRKK